MTWQYNICGACGTDWTTGVVDVTLPAGAVTDGGSWPVEEHSWSFLYDPTAPQAALAAYPDRIFTERTSSLTVDFTEPVAAVTPADVQLVEATLGVVSADSVTLAPDGLSVTLDFSAGLPAAAAMDTYTLTVFDTVRDAAGHALDGDGDGAGGGDYVVQFSVLIVGDANGDGDVGIADLSALADNYGRSPAGWAHGDFSRDGTVGIADLSALADSYGRKVGGSGQAGGLAAGGLDTPNELAVDALAVVAGNGHGVGDLTDDGRTGPADLGALTDALVATPEAALLTPQAAGGGSAVPAGEAVKPSDNETDGSPELDDLVDLLAGPDLNMLTE
jgi:hypothetical protein